MISKGLMGSKLARLACVTCKTTANNPIGGARFLSELGRPTLVPSPAKVIQSLLERTNDLKQQMTVSDSKVISLLRDWSSVDAEEASKGMESVLNHWLQFNKNLNTSEPFNIVLAKHHKNEDGQAAALVLDSWGARLGGHLELAPPLSSFHMVLEAYSNADAEFCINLLGFLERAHLEGNFNLMPTVETYSHVISAIFHNKGNQLSNSIINRLQDTFESEKKSADTCFHMLRAYSKALGIGQFTRHPDAMMWLMNLEKNIKTTDALRMALQFKSPKEEAVSLLGTAYQSALSILLNDNTLEKKAENALRARAMLEYLDSLNLEELPSERHFELVIGCWARNSLLRYNAADVLQQLFSRFEEKHSDKTWKLSATVYQRIISIWCRDGRVEDAEGLLRHFMVLWKENCFHVQSSGLVTKMFNFLLSAYFRQDNPEKVLTVWHEMNHHQVPHDAATYAIVLKALSRLNDRDAGHLAYKIWRDLRSDDKIIEVSAVHYGALISALARSPSRQSAEAAVDALEMLERRYQESNFENHRLKPQQAHYSSTITALSRSNDPKAEEKAYDIFNRMKKSMKPDTIAYSALISALSFGRSEESAEKAEAILEEMEALSDSSDENGVRPNAITYCSCINAWGRSGSRDAPFRAEAILKRLEQRYMASGDITLKPDKMIYVALLHAWSKSRRPEAGKLAEAILRQLESLEKETGESLVDAVIYTNVIVSHWKSNAKNSYLKAESLLQEMKKRVAAGDIKCSPDTFVYTTVIQAYARSVLPNKAEKAWELLEEMCKEYKRGNMALRPNVVSFTACLNACAFTRGDYACRERALKVVLATMAEFRSHTYDTGTPIMYGTLIKAFSNLVQDPEERLRYSGIAFQRCCEEGLVNSVIINVLKDKAPELYNRLPRNRNGEIELHPEWSMNVEEQPYRFPTNHSS